MIEVMTKAREMGASDADIIRWLGKPLAGFGVPPLQLMIEGKTSAVLDALAAMDEGIFG
jgi:hypothetical protein